MNLEQAIERCEDFSRGLACSRHHGLGQALTLVLAAAKRPYALGGRARVSLLKMRDFFLSDYCKDLDCTEHLYAVEAALNLASAPSVLSEGSRVSFELALQEGWQNDYGQMDVIPDGIRHAIREALSLSPPFTREELETLRGFACCADQRWEWDEKEAALAAKLDAYLESLPR